MATNGYFNHGDGTKNKAMAGAGMALPEEAMAIVNNPAVATEVTGRSEIGLALFHPRSNYWSTESTQNGQNGSFTIGPNAIDAESQNMLVPFFARSWQLREQSAFAMALYGRSGINTEYLGGTATFDPDGAGPEPVGTFPGTLGDGDVKTSLSQALLDLTYAQQLNDRFSLGISAVLAAQSFKISGVGTLAPLTQTYASSGGSVMPANLSGNGSDQSYGAGVKVGAHFQWTPKFSLGLMIQSKIYMSSLSSYSDLFASGGDLDIPADFKLGFSWRIIDSVVFSFDLERIFYSDVNALGNSLADLEQCPTAGQGGTDLNSCLGGSNGGGLGWKDMDVVKFGVVWNVGPKWALRAGLSLGDQPVGIAEVTNNLISPYLSEAHYTAGFTRALGSRGELNFAIMYTEEESLHQPNAFDTTQTLNYELDAFEYELSYGWRF